MEFLCKYSIGQLVGEMTPAFARFQERTEAVISYLTTNFQGGISITRVNN